MKSDPCKKAQILRNHLLFYQFSVMFIRYYIMEVGDVSGR